MKLKGINPFEQHVDKIVLGVVALAALGVVAAQFLLDPNKVTIGKSGPVSPALAYGPVETAANDLLGKVREDKPELPPAPKTDVLTRFQNQLKSGVAPRVEPPAMGPVIALGATIDEAPGGAGGAIADMVVPAPAGVTARAFGGTIDPLEVVQHPELKAILPAEQPFDKFAVSVEATFNGAAFKQALQADPDGAGPARAMPLGWVRDSLEIIGVELEREQLGPDGKFGGAKVVPSVPGRPSLLGEFRKGVKGVGDMPAMLERARARADDVQRPDYYTLIAGPAWMPPSESADGATIAERIDAHQKRLNLTDEQLESRRKRLAALGQAPATRQPPGRDGPSGGGKGGGGAEAPPPRQPATNPSKTPTKVETPLEREIKRLEGERERLMKELEDLKTRQASGGKDKPAAEPLRPQSILDNPSVRLWAHDVTAEPGATYKYRVRLVTNNPFFGRDAALTPEQRSLAVQPTTAGEWSDWSDPVAVDRSTYYFVTSASERNPTGPARASVELLQFYYGFFRHVTVGVSPGDTIAGDAKLPPKLMVFDMEKLASGFRPEQPVPGEREGGGGGGKGVAPPAPLPGRGESPKAPGDPQQAAAEGMKPLPEKLTIALDTVLVDVSPAIGQGGAAKKVVLRDAPKSLTVRSPEQATRDSLLERLLKSAKLGESQGQPQVKPREPKPDAQQPDQPPPGLPPRRDPGGGGGGGGG